MKKGGQPGSETTEKEMTKTLSFPCLISGYNIPFP